MPNDNMIMQGAILSIGTMFVVVYNLQWYHQQVYLLPSVHMELGRGSNTYFNFPTLYIYS